MTITDHGPSSANDEELELFLPGRDLDVDERAELIEKFQRRSYGPDEIIIREGRPPENFYVIVKGAVRVVRDSHRDVPHVVTVLGRGDSFGEIGLLYDAPRTASIYADSKEGAEVLALDRETFRRVVASSRMTAEKMSDIMQRRMLGLRLIEALPSLSAHQIREVAPNFEHVHFEPRTRIIHEGDPADRFYIITRGYVEVVRRTTRGRERFVARLGPGEYFGEMGLLRGKPRSASVETVTWPVEAIALDRDSFHALMSESAETETMVARKMIDRLLDLGEL